MDVSLTASQICLAAQCGPSTLRAWRNRNGLFPRLSEGSGWTRYDFADAVGVRIMQIFSERGFAAQSVADLVNAMRPHLEKAAQGYAPFFAVGLRGDRKTLEFRQIKMADTALDAFGWFVDDPIVTVIDLNRLCNEVSSKLRDLRALEQGAHE